VLTSGPTDAALVSDEVIVAGDRLPLSLRYHQPGQPGYRRLLVALFVAGVATFAALWSTQPLIGILAQRFSLPESQAAWSVSVATLLLGIGMLVAGPLSDRWGRTTMIKGSLFATAALGAVCALAPSWPVLLAARAAQGLALAGTPAVALVYLREEVHAGVHPRATGLYIGGTAMGGMTGRLLVGALAELDGWRWAIGGIAALCGVCALLVAYYLPASRHPARLRYQAARAPGQDRAVTSRGRELAAVGRALGDRKLLALYIIAGTLMSAFVALYNVLGLRLTTAPYRLSVFDASLVFCVYPLGSLSSATAGRLAERLGRPRVVLLGILFAIAGLAITLATPLTAVVVGIAMITVGFFAAHGVASGWATALGQRRQAASQASAFYLFSYYLCSTIFGAVGAGLWSSGKWPATAAMAAGLMAIAAIIAAREVTRRT
jgi:MFS transporter, YNFM family, putative membrane transport protein